MTTARRLRLTLLNAVEIILVNFPRIGKLFVGILLARFRLKPITNGVTRWYTGPHLAPMTVFTVQNADPCIRKWPVYCNMNRIGTGWLVWLVPYAVAVDIVMPTLFLLLRRCANLDMTLTDVGRIAPEVLRFSCRCKLSVRFRVNPTGSGCFSWTLRFQASGLSTHRFYRCGGCAVRRLYDVLQTLAEGCEASGSRFCEITSVLCRFGIRSVPEECLHRVLHLNRVHGSSVFDCRFLSSCFTSCRWWANGNPNQFRGVTRPICPA